MGQNQTLIVQGRFELTPFTGNEEANVPALFKTDDGLLNAGILIAGSQKNNPGKVLVSINAGSNPSPIPVSYKYVPIEDVLGICYSDINDPSNYQWKVE